MKLGNYNIMFSHDVKKRKTKCRVTDANEGLIDTSESRCNSSDIFNKRLGRKLSLARAIVTLPRPTRIIIWEDYKKSCRLQK